jgi:uncharacterized membrane protein YeaQ/YmgE (transglycosylase-associated protein family)
MANLIRGDRHAKLLIEKEIKNMSLESLVIWIIVGAIAGLLADAVVGGVRLGLVGAILVGIVGAVIGGWLLSQLGLAIGAGIIGTIITAFIGAVILLLILRAIRRA